MTDQRLLDQQTQPHNDDDIVIRTLAVNLTELVKSLGLKQDYICKRIDDIIRLYARPGVELESLDKGTLSRILNGRNKKPPTRDKFDAVVLTCLYLNWEKDGSVGEHPTLKEARDYWPRWMAERTISQSSQNDASTSVSGNASTPAGRDQFDIEKNRFEGAFGPCGVRLLDEARSGNADAAFRLGILCVLDSRPVDAEKWLRTAVALGNIEASQLTDLGDWGPEAQKLAADYAYAHAREIARSPDDATEMLLFLKQAAPHSHSDAAYYLGIHYDLYGNRGSAVRWFGEAEKFGDPHARHLIERLTPKLPGEEGR